jgi:hypothetical protein
MKSKELETYSKILKVLEVLGLSSISIGVVAAILKAFSVIHLSWVQVFCPIFFSPLVYIAIAIIYLMIVSKR